MDRVRHARRLFMARVSAWGIATAMVCVLPVAVEAKTSFDCPYTLAQTYNAALRLVRVDLGLAITERDPSAAYLLFEYKSSESGTRAVPGSIEMLDSGRNVKVVVQLNQMPRYHEQVLSDALTKKLREEYGEPTPREPKGNVPDAGVDAPEY